VEGEEKRFWPVFQIGSQSGLNQTLPQSPDHLGKSEIKIEWSGI